MRQNPHVRICGGPGSATTLVYPTPPDYQKTTVYLSKQLHRNVRIACLKATPPLDMSDVVAQQLTDWLKMQDLDS